MNGRIYKIWNDVNDKLYIGKTTDTIQNRFEKHKRDAIRIRNEQRPLYNAMNKYGSEHFYIELIEECPLEELAKKEIYWIGYYDTYHNGYNATLGGDGKILYDYNLIIQLFEEGLTETEISQILKCDVSVVRKALQDANYNTRSNQIKKVSKQVAMYDKTTNQLLKVFDSQIEAGRWLQQNNYTTEKRAESISARIGQVCSGQRKTAYGYKWARLSFDNED